MLDIMYLIMKCYERVAWHLIGRGKWNNHFSSLEILYKEVIYLWPRVAPSPFKRVSKMLIKYFNYVRVYQECKFKVKNVLRGKERGNINVEWHRGSSTLVYKCSLVFQVLNNEPFGMVILKLMNSYESYDSPWQQCSDRRVTSWWPIFLFSEVLLDLLNPKSENTEVKGGLRNLVQNLE